MDCKDVLIDGLGRVEESLRMTLEGLSAEQLAFRPAEHANSLAWLAWHLTRVEDDHVADLAGTPQAWIADGWHARFNRPASSHETGFGHGPQEVATIRPESPLLLVDYYAAVHQRSLEYLRRLSCQDLDRVIDTRWDPPVTVGVRLVSVINDATQHVGQMAYLRGLVENKKWLPY
ncbi:MAG: DinB family protein [Chloroflexota bacterium]|nr:DinB family protein [Chloroflexota bacterium]